MGKPRLMRRWLGHELLAILPECNASEVVGVCERLRNVVRRAPVPWWGDSLQITISLGATTVIVQYQSKTPSADPAPDAKSPADAEATESPKEPLANEGANSWPITGQSEGDCVRRTGVADATQRARKNKVRWFKPGIYNKQLNMGILIAKWWMLRNAFVPCRHLSFVELFRVLNSKLICQFRV